MGNHTPTMASTTTLVIFLFGVISVCHSVQQLHFKKKYTSSEGNDHYGTSIDANADHLVIGASDDHHGKGAVYVQPDGTKILAPRGKGFGRHVAISDEFIFVVGQVRQPYGSY